MSSKRNTVVAKADDSVGGYPTTTVSPLYRLIRSARSIAVGDHATYKPSEYSKPTKTEVIHQGGIPGESLSPGESLVNPRRSREDKGESLGNPCYFSRKRSSPENRCLTTCKAVRTRKHLRERIPTQPDPVTSKQPAVAVTRRLS